MLSCAALLSPQVTNVREASRWLSYTYLHTRMAQNPLAYGIPWEELAADHALEGHRRASHLFLQTHCPSILLSVHAFRASPAALDDRTAIAVTIRQPRWGRTRGYTRGSCYHAPVALPRR